MTSPQPAGDPGEREKEQGGGQQEGLQDQARPRPGKERGGIDGRAEQEQEQDKETGAEEARRRGEEALQIGVYLDPSEERRRLSPGSH